MNRISRCALGLGMALVLAPLATLAAPPAQLQQIGTGALPIEHISRTAEGTFFSRSSGSPSISADGRFVAFESWAAIVPEDLNDGSDIYVHDRQTGAVEFLGAPGVSDDVNLYSDQPAISADGRFVVFRSDSPYLVPGDQNEADDVFLYERATGAFTRLNLTAGGEETDAYVADPAISADGRYVAFTSSAVLMPDDDNGFNDIYIVDTSNGALERAGGSDHRSDGPSLSADGRFVAFDSLASDLVPDDTNDERDVFVLDRDSGEIELVSVSTAGEQGLGPSETAVISADGRFVVFESKATNFGPDGSGASHVYIHERQTGVTELVDSGAYGTLTYGISIWRPQRVVSDDGRFVLFSSASALVPEDSNGTLDVYLRDRELGTTALVSLSPHGLSGDAGSGGGVMSADGRYIAFLSGASNLVYFDDDDYTQGYGPTDVFVRDMQAAYPVSPFQATHDRTDLPVAEGQATRTWTWAPDSFTGPIYEPYGESEETNLLPFEQRAVQYFDKSRMEISNPGDDPNSVWYVTNGLLVVEMITGELQVSDEGRLQLAPARVSVAGDLDDPDSPTYASLAGLLDTPPHPFDQPVIASVDQEGMVTFDDAFAVYGVDVALIDDVTGHAIAAPFWDFMTSNGIVYENGQFLTDLLFEDPYFATGRPVTEAYWASVLVGGVPSDVLFQCFERRCLTYNPANEPVWQVEAGNVGLHYYQWRYDVQPLAPEIEGEIVYTDGYHLNVLTHAGLEEIYAAPQGFEIYAPAWSPDGSQIAFILWDDVDHSALYIVNADGSGAAPITDGENVSTFSSSVSWSPGGGRLAYASDGTIVTINADGSGRTEIGPGIDPVWSPLGDRIAFVHRDDRIDTLRTMDVDGGNVTDVADGHWNSYSGYAVISSHAWSPDGTQHHYLSPYQGPAGAHDDNLYVVNTDGSGDHWVATGFKPGWSPDGSLLTYSMEYVVYTLDPDSSKVRGLLWDFSNLPVRDYDWSG